MKTEMNMFTQARTGKQLSDRKGSSAMEKRNDSMYETNNSSMSGNNNSGATKETRFRDRLDSAAKETRRQKNGERKNSISGDKNPSKCSEKQQLQKEKSKWENIIAGETVEDKFAGGDTVSSEKALAIIKEVLASISEKLHLNVNFAQGLNDLDCIVPSDAVCEQFSEILFALQGIAQLLEQALQNNVALDIKGVVIEPHEAALLEQSLRVEIFRLQVAFGALGIAGKVSDAVSEKLQRPNMDGGIPRAKDPSSLSMPDNQLQQLLGDRLGSKEDTLASIVARIAAVAKEKTLGGRLSALVNGKNPGSPQVSVTVSDVSSEKPVETGKTLDPGSFNSQILRTLLKIDENGQPLTVAGNSDEKADQSAALSLKPGTRLSLKQNFQQVVTVSQNLSENTGDQISGIENVMRGDGNAVEMSQKLPAMPFKSAEESVMLQVTQRLNTAVRNGLHEIRLHLRPESLGNVRMTIQMEGDIVVARINVENQQVKQIIESNLQSLKDSLEEQNLHAGSFDVNVNHGSEKEDHEATGSGKSIHDVKNAGESPEDSIAGSNSKLGMETGRHYGSNTIEYFA